MIGEELQAHTAQLVDNLRTEWLLSFDMPTDDEVFPDHDEQIIYTLREDAPVTHMVTFHVLDAWRRGYHRVLSLGATGVKTARRIVSHSDWEDVTP